MTNPTCKTCDNYHLAKCQINSVLLFDTVTHKQVTVYIEVKEGYLCKNWKESLKI